METNTPEQGEVVATQRAAHRCAFGAPERCGVELENGKFYTRQWHTRNDKGQLWNEKWHYEYTVLGLHATPQPRIEAKPQATPVQQEDTAVNRVDAIFEALSKTERDELHRLLLGEGQ